MLSIICGTNRPDSNSIKVAQFYADLLRVKGEESQILNLEDLPKDFAFNAMYGKKQEEVTAAVDRFIHPVDKLVFVIPEYHGSYPGVLKTFLDCMTINDVQGKTAALVGISDGAAGNLRGLDDLTNVLHFLRVEVLARKPKISRVHELLTEEGKLSDERSKRILTEQIDHLLKR